MKRNRELILTLLLLSLLILNTFNIVIHAAKPVSEITEQERKEDQDPESSGETALMSEEEPGGKSVMALPQLPAAQAENSLTKAVNNGYFFRVVHPKEGRTQSNLSKMSINGRNAFCVEPDVQNAYGDIYDKKQDALEYFGDKELINRLSYIIVKGYELTDQSWHDVLITKLAVWAELGWEPELVQDQRDLNKVTDITAEVRQEIESLQSAATRYLKPADLDSSELEFFTGRTYEIKDKNSVISDYKLKSAPAGVTVEIKKDRLIISLSDQTKSGPIVLEKTNIFTGDSLVYVSDTSQNIFVAGELRDLNETLNIKVHPRKQIRLVKYDANNKEALAGAKFALASDPAFNKIIAEASSDSKGEIIFSDLELLPDTLVYLRELAAPDAYQLDTTIHEIKIGKDVEYVLNVENVPQEGELLIRKRDQDNPDMAIAGVSFQIARDEDFSVDLREGVTDAQGLLMFDKLEIPAGATIYVREVSAADGYILDPTVKTALIEPGKCIELIFENKMKTADVKIRKIDADTAAPLADVKFELARDSAFTIDRQEAVTNADGEILFQGLELYLGSNIFLREIETAKFYETDKNIYELTLLPGEETVIEIKNSPQTGSLIIKKVDQDNNEKVIAGAKFEIARDADFTIDLLEGVSDAEGYIYFPNLKLLTGETIYIREVTAPEEYIPDPKVRTVLLQANETIELLWENKLKTASIIIRKTDADTGKALSGISFSIFDVAGNKLNFNLTDGSYHATDNGKHQVLYTNEKGEIYISGLLPGHFSYQEVKTLKGYILDPTKHDFLLTLENTDSDPLILELGNHLLPATGESVSRLGIYLLITGTILAMSVAVITKHKQKS